MSSGRYLAKAQKHFLRGFAAFFATVAAIAWAALAALHQSFGWFFIACMAALAAAVITWRFMAESIRCFQISERFNRWTRQSPAGTGTDLGRGAGRHI